MKSSSATFWIVVLGSSGALVAALADIRGELSAAKLLLLGLLALALLLLAREARRASGRADQLAGQLRELVAQERDLEARNPRPRTISDDGFAALESALAELVQVRKLAPRPADELVRQLAEAWKQAPGTPTRDSDGRLIELTNQVFVYKQLQATAPRLDEGELDVTEMIARCFAHHRAEADRKHLLLLSEGRALRLRANPDVLGFSIGNLLADAVANAPALTTITVYTAIDNAGDVRISFADDRGAEPGAANPGVEPGIGTQITRRLVELQGGRLLIAGRSGFNAFTSIVLPGNRLIPSETRDSISLAA